ncbi:pyridoxal phosphate-dependent aminotransferase [uncultured Ornithinimicrobium sp.]|uniref:pyridoxal phosphate-dependent aminotransferase n=1 Tax=uncultured Ornithinimicrobium sp. TaxID=259307 RepID=UPI00259A01F2|nr:pyridoxal phosphate-dependent aminotransferase [uncultured Ornithinimicrobium sp.]
MTVAARVDGLAVSPIRRMAVGAPEGTLSLALGEPGWPMPAPARRSLEHQGRTDGPLPYGPNSSSPELVAAVAGQHGIPLAPEEVMVTSGSQAALFALFHAHVEAGSAVLVPDPGFVAYRSLAQLCQAQPVGYALGPGGALDVDLVEAALGEALRSGRPVSVVVVNHPANPTGGLADAESLRRVAELCARHGAVLVSDEVYRELWVGAGGQPGGLHEVAGLAAGVVLGSVSKAFGAPGLRVGWAVGPAELLAPARVVHNAMTTAPARPSQDAATALLTSAGEVLPAARREVARRWDVLAEVAPELLALADAAAGRPDARPAAGTGSCSGQQPAAGTGSRSRSRAGFYLWLPLPAYVDPAGTTAFALRVRDESLVTTVPGDAFGPRGAGFLRVSLGGPVDALVEGLVRLAPWWEG